MISPELLRRYPYFAGLNGKQIPILARVASEATVEANHYFFQEGDELKSLYLVLEGMTVTVIEVPDREAKQNLSAQLTGKLQTKDVVIGTVGPGEVFGWSALVAPYKATASAKATTPCRVVEFDCRELRRIFAEDCQFGYLMLQKAAQVGRDRLHNMRIESLAYLVG